MKKQQLSRVPLKKELQGIPLWKLNNSGTKLTRTFSFPDFKRGLRFVNKIGKEAERMGHHPDINLSYGKVRMALMTHDVKGLTEKDILLAKAIDRQLIN